MPNRSVSTFKKLILREQGSGAARNILGHFFNEPGARHLKDTIEMGSNETIKQAVMAGLGI